MRAGYPGVAVVAQLFAKKLLPILLAVFIGITGASAQSDRDQKLGQKLWNDLLRGCDKAAALKDIEKTIPLVTPEYVYPTMRDIYSRHLCSERELKADLEASKKEKNARAMPPVLPPSPSPSAQPAPRAALVCGPQLTAQVVRNVDRADPSADPEAKLMAIRGLLEMMGCLAPSPPKQTTTCTPLAGGGFTCTTQ
jgi:hypothetical protein